ncbi:MAG: biotin--[acetyl-CoA-carboxylase] ligase [Candidatus Omnitrophota bacterium]|nr:MAG: biotin--[acetyl-CoA-carboxylase] ligase [Candidatus Omnitrophota bacterium]
MDEKILKILRTHRDKFTSAEELARRVSLSKPTLARHISKLGDEGYDIQHQPHLGYKLVGLPDRLAASEVKWQLNTKIIGRKVLSYNVVDSTNTTAFSLARQGAPCGTAVFAEGQKKGRGRRGRGWVSPTSKGIYLSLVLRPHISSNEASLITLLAAASCAESIRSVCGLKALIRWPNDILVNNKKVCGILTEIETEGNRVKFIILGIGINVERSKLPPEAGTLRKETKRDFSRLDLARELLQHLDKHYRNFERRGAEDLIREWKNLSAFSGRRVKVFLAHKTIEGQAQDIDDEGALIVRLDSGFREHVTSADIVKIR